MFLNRVQKDDVAGINILSAIDTEVFDTPWTAGQWLTEVENSANHVNLVYLDRELLYPVGFLTYGISGDTMELKKIAILNQFRRKHIALKALEIMIERGRSLNMNNIIIEVAITNVAAIRLYEKLGFYNVNVRKKYYNNLVDACVMQKEI